MELSLLWTVQLAPLAAFFLIQLLPAPAKKAAPLVGVAGALTAATAAGRLVLSHLHPEGLPMEFVYPWLWVGEGRWLSVGFLLDPLNLLMILLVTVIAFFVQVFSYYYMAEDPSRARYFGFLSFFSFSMTGLVLSNNLLQTFLFWELVGLASYLLIGFWYQKPSAATAARKAFVINRLADLGFYLGIILLFLWFGTLDFLKFDTGALKAALSPGALTLVGLLVFTGVMGKSAQFPFHVWLPDAMEGPTPVSALIHSATMVAAGVFLSVRAFGLFAGSETTLLVMLIAGTLTALTGAFVATVQDDIKKIMAYSTVSQLGLMVMAVGAGSPAAGMFHLSTHACFKSLLFLTAGAFIHHFHTNDVWEIAKKGGKKDFLAAGALAFGLLSLCGIPPFAGFFSKDMVLEAIKHRSVFFYALSLLVNLLTAYYSFRLFFILIFSKEEKPGHGHGHGHDAHAAHESPLLAVCRAIPLVTLALLSLWVGALGTPLTHHALFHWMGWHPEPLNNEIALTNLVLAALSAGFAFWKYRDPKAAAERLKSGRTGFGTVLERKFYIDDAYEFLVKKVGLAFAGLLNRFDKSVPNALMVDKFSFRILDLGKLASRLQSGLLQDYLSLAMGAAGLVALFFLLNRGL